MTDSYGSSRNEPPSIWNQARSPGASMGPYPPTGGARAGPYPPWMTNPVRPSPPPRPHLGIGAIGLAIVIVMLLVAGFTGVAVVDKPAGSQRAATRPPVTKPNGPTVPTTQPAPATSLTPVMPLTPVNPPTPKPQNPIAPVTGRALTASPAAIAAMVNPSVVDIDSQLGYQNAAAAGTGMVLTSSGLVLTNNHVVDGATAIVATVVGNGRVYTATVVGVDPTRDVAVLQLQGASGLAPIKPGNPGTVAAGDSVVAIGNAGGVGGSPSVVTGTVLATAQTVTATDSTGANAERLTGLIETNAPLQPGDSGGPLVNGSGLIIGMDTAASTDTQFRATDIVSFAIPIDQAMAIAAQIESGQASSSIRIGLPAFLGVQILVPGSARRGGPPGAVVGGVVAGSPAAKAGLRAGDTITSVDGQAIDSGPTLTTLLRQHRPGDSVVVGWVDQAGGSHRAMVTLIIGPAD